MNPLFVSIIIPVFNDDANLPRCLDSVLAQEYKYFECILINDGSTDNCPIICDEYKKNDKRFIVFHKKNEGISKTRQFGFNHATGEYIIFIDSDDWVEPQYLLNAVKKINEDNTDIIFFDFLAEFSPGKKRYITQNHFAADNETIISLVLEGKISSYLWSAAIKREFCHTKNVFFVQNVNYGEDTLFILELLLNNPQAGYLPQAHYHHCYNRNSFTRKDVKQKYSERLNFLNQIPLLLEKYNRNDLTAHNFFPHNDKFEMLNSGLFSKKEYHAFFPLTFNRYYKSKTNLHKYLMLFLAETNFYFLAKRLAVFWRYIVAVKRHLLNRKSKSDY